MPFSEIVRFVRARVPRLSEERIRAEFARRLRRNPAAAPDCAAVASPLEDVAPLYRSPLARRELFARRARLMPWRRRGGCWRHCFEFPWWWAGRWRRPPMAASLRAARACLRVFA